MTQKQDVCTDYESGLWVPAYYGLGYTVAKKRKGIEREEDLTFRTRVFAEARAEADNRNGVNHGR